MAGGTQGSIERLLACESLVGMSKSNTKSKTLSEEGMCLLTLAHSCPQIKLDTADFLIDGLTCLAPYGAGA